MKKTNRCAVVNRKSKETDISLKLNLDGSGISLIKTEIPFLTHMLELFTRHGNFDLRLTAKGDTHIDIHHLNEDIEIALGTAFKNALGSKIGIMRYGFFYLPMDQALARVVIDISNRPFFIFKVAKGEHVETSPSYKMTDCLHFLESLSFHMGLSLHVDVLRGGDFHHVIEAVFKALSRALSMAVSINPRASRKLPSTKGLL